MNKNLYSNKIKNWEFDKEVPPIFQIRRASVFIDTERGVDEKAMEKPIQSKTNSLFCLSILTLSLLTTSGMIQGAAEENAYPCNTYYCDACSCNSCCCDDYGCDTCSCSPCDCETCCTPKPQESIDCECYTPAFYDLQCDWGFFINGEFLYWYARETNLPYAARLILKKNNAVNPGEEVNLGYVKKFEHFDTKWDPGLRVGVGVNSKCDGWDYYLNWTYFHNSEKQSHKIPQDVTNPTLENEIFLNPWINSTNFLFFSFGTPTPRTFSLFNTIAAKWKIHFNQIDLEIGRKYWLSRCFTLRPYAGSRGAWTKTVFSETGTRGPLSDDIFDASNFFSRSTDQFNNRLWGAGFFLGLQPNWYFCHNFLLYANFDGALLWGEFQSKKKESLFSSGIKNSTNTIFVDLRHTSKDSFFTMSALIDLGIGFRWEENWCCDRYRTSLDIGWEHHIWFDHGYRYKTFGSQLQDTSISNIVAISVPENYAYDVSNLIYGGLVVRLRFDF